LHIPLRSDTTVPQQALFFLNHPLMVGYAQALAGRTAPTATGENASGSFTAWLISDRRRRSRCKRR
jgi:hypothetical protein